MKTVTVLLLCCVLVSGCDSGVDDRQDETIAKLQEDLRHTGTYIGNLIAETNDLKQQIHNQKRIREWQHEYLNANQHDHTPKETKVRFSKEMIEWAATENIDCILDWSSEGCEVNIRVNDGCRSSRRVDLYRMGEPSLTQDQLKP